MGRGRQKAKQTKVARRLKYYSPETDYKALEQELSGQGHDSDTVTDDSWEEGENYSSYLEDDKYEEWKDER